VALNIKDAEADRLARQLAAETGETITVAACRAFQERLDRVRRRRGAASAVEELDAVIARGRARATLDGRDVDEILGYGAQGLPG
jgi:antitoxin VapB